MKRQEFGFDQWFEEQASKLNMDGCGIARVTAVDRGSCLIADGVREVPAELSGKLSFQLDSPADLPCVGDWVTARHYNDDTTAIIHRVLPRRTFLRRKTPGATIDSQMIAANIDTAFLVQSCHFDFNPSRLERYLVMALDGHVDPLVLLTKTDLVSPEDLEEKRAAISAITQARVIALSTVTGGGIEELQQTLAPGRTYCLLGSSGVGKTTLLNRLLGQRAFETRAVSGTGEGTHTTTRRQLVRLEQGAMLVDTPGMRELGMAGAGVGVEAGFADVAALAALCRYADCSHQREPGCAVRAAIEQGELPGERYASYLKLKKEAEFHGLSQLDRRRKDKAFGRHIKALKKHMEN
jgi:ribosome biogenesis GTPase